MSLYLCIFDRIGNDVEGVDVGKYEDFGQFREFVCQRLEGGKWGSRFPTLMLHSDCDGIWNRDQCRVLLDELRVIQSEMQCLPPKAWPPGWQEQTAKFLGLAATNACESFIDADGEPLVERLAALAEKACTTGYSIHFQ